MLQNYRITEQKKTKSKTASKTSQCAPAEQLLNKAASYGENGEWK